MAGKDGSKYTLKRSEKVKTLAAIASVKLSGKDGAIFFPDLLFQSSVALANGCNIRFDNCKGHELWVYIPTLFESTI